jgi:hypothetical protein
MSRQQLILTLAVRLLQDEGEYIGQVYNGVLDSWIKGDKLDVTSFFISLFNAQHVSDINTSILRSLWLICWVIPWFVLLWYDVCWWTLWFGCGDVVWYAYAGWRLQPDITPPKPNHTVTPTRIVPEQYNPWNNSTNMSQAPEVVCINIRNMSSIK